MGCSILISILLYVLADESEARETRLLSNGLWPRRKSPSANRLGRACALRDGAAIASKKAVELNSRVPAPNKTKAGKSRKTLDFLHTTRGRSFIFTFSELRKRDREAAWKRTATGNRVCAACSAIRSRSPSLNCYSIVVFMTAFPGFNVEH